MNAVIKTERLILRLFEIKDSKDLFELNSNPEVLKFTGDIPFNSLEETESFLINYKEYELNGFGRWAVILKENFNFIGWCGLKLNEENHIDLGFRFKQEEWFKGYATEAAKACLDYGIKKLDLQRIVGRTSVENIASIKVLEKIGMCYWKEKECVGMGLTKYYIYEAGS